MRKKSSGFKKFSELSIYRNGNFDDLKKALMWLTFTGFFLIFPLLRSMRN